MKTVYYHGDFNNETGKRIQRGTVIKILDANLDAIKRQGYETSIEALDAIQDGTILKIDGKELWEEEA